MIETYKEKILELYESGLSQIEISRELGCAKSTVHYHLNDKSAYVNRTAMRRDKNKTWFKELTKDNKCIICGEDESVCLDYHHIFPEDKHREVSRLVNECYSREIILKEIDKCICVCSNCHRKLHANILLIEDYV